MKIHEDIIENDACSLNDLNIYSKADSVQIIILSYKEA